MVYQKKGKKRPGRYGYLEESPLGLDLESPRSYTEGMSSELGGDEDEEETPRERMYRQLREKALERRAQAQKGLEEMEDPMEQASRAEEQMRLASLMKGLMGAASKFGSHQPKSDMGHLGEMAQSRVREAEGAKKRQARLQSALESAENRLLALRKGERGEVLEDAREERAQAGEKRAGEMHDLSKKQKQIQTKETEREVEHLDSPIDDVTKAYLQKGLDGAGVKNIPNMDNLTYRQLQKHPVLSKAIKVGSTKANYQRTALQDPDGVVREYVVDVNNPKDKRLVGTKGYSPDSYFDPYTGQRVRTAKQPGGGRPAATGSTSKAPSSPAPKGQPQEPQEISFQQLNPKQREKLDDTRKAYDSSADVKKAKEMLSSADGVDEILALAEQGEAVDPQLVGRYLAKASGEVGNLAEHDVKPYGGRTGLKNTIDRLKAKWINGEMVQGDIDFLRKISETFRTSGKARMENELNLKSSRLANDFGISQDNARKLLEPGYSAPRAKPQRQSGTVDNPLEAEDWRNLEDAK